MKHIVQYSTGAASAEVAWRLVDKHGPDSVVLLTADTRVEDSDNWRFAHEVHGWLGCEWVVLADGRTPMQVGRDRKVVPNNRMAVCSLILKRKLLRTWIDAHCDPSDTVIYLGYGWMEAARIEAAWPNWAPYRVAAPLAQPPYMDKHEIFQLFRDRGIEPPGLYADGFQHANCGGACVRGGQASWELLLRKRPATYAEWETEEEKSRALLGKDVSILRDRAGGTTHPLPLRVFRERLEQRDRDTGDQGELFDAGDWGACGCFTPGDETEGT